MRHSEFEVRPTTLDEILGLRHRVLRAGLPRETSLFGGDEAPTTRHLAAMDRDGLVVGCATLHLNELNGETAWQLRGMAVAP